MRQPLEELRGLEDSGRGQNTPADAPGKKNGPAQCGEGAAKDEKQTKRGGKTRYVDRNKKWAAAQYHEDGDPAGAAPLNHIIQRNRPLMTEVPDLLKGGGESARRKVGHDEEGRLLVDGSSTIPAFEPWLQCSPDSKRGRVVEQAARLTLRGRKEERVADES
jgi:hypothetical protein